MHNYDNICIIITGPGNHYKGPTYKPTYRPTYKPTYRPTPYRPTPYKPTAYKPTDLQTYRPRPLNYLKGKWGM